jgi:hypothetical protein
MKTTKLRVDQNSILAELKQIEKNAIILQKIKKDLSNIGVNEILNKTQLDAHLLSGTSYTNAKLVAELKNFDYTFYIENHAKINESFYNEDYTIKDNIIKAIQEKHTIYLTEEQEAIKKKLDKIAELLNEINIDYFKALYKRPSDAKLETHLESLIQINNLHKSNRM